MWLGIGSVADVYPTMNIAPRLRERREAELLSQFAQLRQQIYQWSPQARAPVGPQSGPIRARGDRVSLWPAFCIEHSIIILISKYFEPQQRMPFFCHAWCWLHPRGGDQHIEQIWTDLGLPWPCIFWTFAHIIIYHPGMGIYEHVRASAGDAQCRLAQQLLVPSEFCAFAHDLPMICWHIMGG